MNYEQNGPSYDSGDPYNQWGNNGVQDPYYGQNSGYGNDYPSYGGPPGGYEDQNYGSYEGALELMSLDMRDFFRVEA